MVFAKYIVNTKLCVYRIFLVHRIQILKKRFPEIIKFLGKYKMINFKLIALIVTINK